MYPISRVHLIQHPLNFHTTPFIGVQSSWGSGEAAVELIEKALKQYGNKL